MASGRKTFVFADVVKHDKVDDCWVIIAGKVYDVTTFLDDHPGGQEPVLSSTGKDATKDFEVIGHSDEAVEMMKKYYIGDVDQSTVPLEHTTDPSQDFSYQAEEKSGGESYTKIKSGGESYSKILQFLVPIVIIGVAFTIKIYAKETSV